MQLEPNTEQGTVTLNVLTTSSSSAEKLIAKVGFSLKQILTLELANGDLAVLKWICGKPMEGLKLLPLILAAIFKVKPESLIEN